MANYEVSKNNVEVTEDGKVLITSEELANAVQGWEVELTTEEEAEGNGSCSRVISIF